MEIKSGMLVWLKSGGPKMTVKKRYTSPKEWFCSWFNGVEFIERAIHEDQLTDKDPNEYEREDTRHPIGYKSSSS